MSSPYDSSPFTTRRPNTASDVRLSDEERNDAMNRLARAVGEGRLTIEEFEERSDEVLSARCHSDLVPIFFDIPAQLQQPKQPYSAQGKEVKEFSRADIEKLRQQGRKTRLGLALLTTITASVAGPFLVSLGGVSSFFLGQLLGVGLGLAVLLIIPTVWIALYLLKVGPAEWYAPSPKQLEREKRRQIRSEITTEVMDLARNRISKWNSGRM